MSRPLDYEELGDGVTCVDTGYLRPGMTACYLLEQGGHLAIIETGVNANVDGLLALIEQKGISRDNVDYIIPTHVHLDHAGGVGRLMQALPSARLLIHPRGARHMIDPTALIAGVTAVYGEEIFALHYGELLPVDSDRVVQAEDEFVLDFYGRPLRFLDTPGHARHHFCIVDEHSQGIFSGDTFGLSYREFDHGTRLIGFPTTTPVQFDPDSLHQSIDRLISFNPSKIYLTHYGCIQQVSAMADQLHQDIDQFVDMTRSIFATTSHDCEAQLEQTILDYLYGRVKQVNPGLEYDLVKSLLMLDCRLNAQGLENWISSNNH